MLAHIPVWVFAIFFGLLALGWRHSRPRSVAPRALVGLAVGMAGLSLYGVLAAFGGAWPVMLTWAIGMAVSVGLGRGVLGPRGMVREAKGRVHLPGSWLPLAMLMGIFVAKFALGFAAAMGAGVISQPGFVLSASAVFGLLSGGFAARAWTVQRFAALAAQGVVPADPAAALTPA